MSNEEDDEKVVASDEGKDVEDKPKRSRAFHTRKYEKDAEAAKGDPGEEAIPGTGGHFVLIGGKRYRAKD